MGEHRVLFSTVPSRDVAESLSQALVSRKLAACVNILPNLTSVYRWQGAVEKEEELLLIIKTSESLVEPLVETIADLHPYDVPEVISLPIETGHAPYLTWIDDSVGSDA